VLPDAEDIQIDRIGDLDLSEVESDSVLGAKLSPDTGLTAVSTNA